jgi:4,4'-diaponeurosporenoate glycosyltransferase
MKWIIYGSIWLLGFFLLGRIPLCSKPKDHRRQKAVTQTLTRVSVIIPARNEEGVLSNLLSSLRRQTAPAHEIIVVNDGSTDRTGELAREAGAVVIDLDEPPEGWVGKTWACFSGAKTASGDYFLFLDADTWLEDEGLEKIMNCQSQHSGVITIAPFHAVQKPYEDLSLFFNVMAGAGMRTFTILGNRIKPAGLFGPCFFCSREDYFKINGHASVKGSIVEDVEIGRTFVEAGIPLHGFGGEGTISLRMYPHGFDQLQRGWTKNIGIGAKLTSPLFAGLITLWFAGVFKTAFDFIRTLLLLKRPSAQSSFLYGAYAGQIHWMSRRVGSFSPWSAVLFPIPLFYSAYIYVRSFMRYAMGQDVQWKGRAITTQETASD